ncbi:DUF2997 domain-containing protein [Synechococcus sp. H70.1]|uniref:DUF2997 domain-containing protein n=2 Tax=unclassified Synechococcus TaxID=2626047 RepID=UPI0039C70C84
MSRQMPEYLKIEYRIDKSGQVTETVLNGSGSSCTLATAELEAALGRVQKRELLPEFHPAAEAAEESQVSLQQTC